MNLTPPQQSGSQPPVMYPQPHDQGPTWTATPPQPKGLSVASMVLGICSIFLGWTFIAPIVGFILGMVGLRREPTGKAMARTGVILNALMLSGWALLLLVAIGILADSPSMTNL